jgi:hypothetical protein
MLTTPMMALVVALAVPSVAQVARLSRAAIFASPTPAWQAAIGGAGAAPQAALLESRGLSPSALLKLPAQTRAVLLSQVRAEAAVQVRAEAAASLARPAVAAQDEDRVVRLSALGGRLSSCLEPETVEQVRTEYSAALEALGEERRARVRRRVEAETRDWTARAPRRWRPG